MQDQVQNASVNEQSKNEIKNSFVFKSIKKDKIFRDMLNKKIQDIYIEILKYC